MYKYENTAEVGQRIRSYDFQGRQDCYKEGTVIAKDVKGDHPAEIGLGRFACYVVAVDTECWRDETTEKTMKIFVPMEIGMGADYDGRIVLLG